MSELAANFRPGTLFKYRKSTYNSREKIWRTGSIPPEKKREVMCMEQISYLIVQYADEIAVAAGGFALILLAVALHRIKRMEKTMREILGRLPLREKVIASAEPARQEAVSEPAESKETGASEGRLPEDAAELLDAVLDEVFL